MTSINSGATLTLTERSDGTFMSRDYQNQRVILRDGREGVIKYVGAVHFLPGVVFGIQLDDPYEGVCNGTVAGWKYFKAPPNKAIFVKRNQARIVESPAPTVVEEEKQISEQVSIPEVSENHNFYSENSSDEEVASRNAAIKIDVGSRVGLSEDRTGTVRFIGAVHFQPGVLVGIELDPPFIGIHDGSVNDWRYFRCEPHRGIFIKRKDIQEVIEVSESESQELGMLEREATTLSAYIEKQHTETKIHVIGKSTGCVRRTMYTLLHCSCLIALYEYLAMYLLAIWRILDHATDFLVVCFFYHKLPFITSALFTLNFVIFSIRWYVSLRLLHRNTDLSTLPCWKTILILVYISPLGILINSFMDVYRSLFRMKKFSNDEDIEFTLSESAFHHFIQLVIQSVPSIFINLVIYIVVDDISRFLTCILAASLFISIIHSITVISEVLNFFFVVSGTMKPNRYT